MQHLDEGTIHSWLDGALSAADAARAEAHVKECARCAAAVAEARGFIAASSRILTALDNVPRNVVPAAAPRRRVDPMVWRIAATMLVVAGGTLVVLRSGAGKGRPTSSESSAISATVLQPRSEGQLSPVAPDTQGITSTGTGPRSLSAKAPGQVFSEKAAAPNSVAGQIAGKAPSRVSESDFSRTAASHTARPDVDVTQKRSDARTVNPEVRENVQRDAAASPTAGAGAPVTLSAATPAFVPLRRATAMDATADRIPRVVGTPRVIGEKQTLYEVAPGDTVLLAEVLKTRLESVVVTGAGVARSAVPPSPRGQAETRSPAVASAPAPTAPDSQAAKAITPQRAVGLVKTGVSAAQTVNGVTTLTWIDPVTGNTMKLSGRHTRDELLEIKRNIDRAKAGAPAVPQR